MGINLIFQVRIKKPPPFLIMAISWQKSGTYNVEPLAEYYSFASLSHTTLSACAPARRSENSDGGKYYIIVFDNYTTVKNNDRN